MTAMRRLDAFTMREDVMGTTYRDQGKGFINTSGSR